MPVFQPSVSLSQSAAGDTVTVTDDSNYSNNSDGVTLNNILSRVDTIVDGLNNPISVVVFEAGSLTATVTLTADAYMANSLLFTLADSSTRTGTENFLAANFYLNAAREVSRALRCCPNDKLCNNAVKADLAYNEAVTATLFGVPSEAQDAINDANSLIVMEGCGC